MKKTQALFIITQYIFTRKAFLVFPFSVVWSMFNDWFDDIRTASRVSTLREKSRSLQRLTLHFARQTTFWFLESILSIHYFPRETGKGSMESLFIPHENKLGCSSLLMVSGKWCCAPFIPGLWKLQHLTRMKACICTFCVCPLCLGNLTFLNWSQHPLHVIALG